MVTKNSNGSSTKHKNGTKVNGKAKGIKAKPTIASPRAASKANTVASTNGKANTIAKPTKNGTKGKQTATTTKPAKVMPPKGQLNTPIARVLGVLCSVKKDFVMSRADVVAGVKAEGVSCYADRIPNETLTYTWLVDAGYITHTTVDIDVPMEGGDDNRTRTVTGHQATPEGRAAHKAYVKAKEKATK